MTRAWDDMTRHDFDVAAPAPVLFDPVPGMTRAPDDGCGTGDLLELLGPDTPGGDG